MCLPTEKRKLHVQFLAVVLCASLPFTFPALASQCRSLRSHRQSGATEDSVEKTISEVLGRMAEARVDSLGALNKRSRQDERLVARFKELGEGAVPALLERLKADPRELDNNDRVAKVLMELGQDRDRGLPVLLAIATAKRKDDEIFWFGYLRIGAMSAAQEHKPDWTRHIPFLLEVTDDPILSNQVREILKELGHNAQKLVPGLIDLIKRKGPSRYYSMALEQIGPPAKDAIPVLIEAVKTAPDDQDRALAARALGMIGPDTKEVVPVLARALRDDSWMVRGWAARALGNVRPPQRDLLPQLIRALDDKAASVRVDVMYALGSWGKIAWDALPRILKLLAKGESDIERQAAAQTLGRIGISSGEVVAALREALRDPNYPLRTAAAQALLRLSTLDESDVLALVPILNQTEAGTELPRVDAMSVLGDFGPRAKKAVPALLKNLRDKDKWVRERAAEELKKIDPEAAKKEGIK